MPNSRTASARLGVLFISAAEKPGADTFVNMLAMRSIDRTRFDVHLACPTPDPLTGADPYARWIGADVHVRRCQFGPSMTADSVHGAPALQALRGTASMLALAAYIRRRGIAIVHASDRPRDVLACRLLCLLTGARAVIHVHVKYGRWVNRAVRWGLRHADAVIGVSAFVADTLVRGGYSAERIHTVLNAIEIERWDPIEGGAAVRREFDIPPDAPLVLCAARLFHWKGQGDLVRIIPGLRRTFPSLRVMIVGEDYQLSPGQSYLQDLKTLVRDLGVEEHVIFSGHRTDMAAVMAACDVFALPSFEEPFGLVFAEAMASKKPVVALNTGGVPEVVDHGRSGLLSTPGDRDGLADNLTTLLRDSELRRRMGEYGRAVVELRFTPSRLAEDVERIYDRIVPKKRTHQLLIAGPA